MEERQHSAQLEQIELHRAANASETFMPDMEFVAAEVMRSRQSEGALRDAMAAQAAAHAQQLRGMQEKTMSQMLLRPRSELSWPPSTGPLWVKSPSGWGSRHPLQLITV
jgi:hypothetical protein